MLNNQKNQVNNLFYGEIHGKNKENKLNIVERKNG